MSVTNFDANNTPINIGDAVMYIHNGSENEGLVTKLLPNNQIEFDGENGKIIIPAADTFVLP